MPIIPSNINYPQYDLTNETVSSSFQRILQIDPTASVYDGTGSLLYNLSNVITNADTGSFTSALQLVWIGF